MFQSNMPPTFLSKAAAVLTDTHTGLPKMEVEFIFEQTASFKKHIVRVCSA